MSWLSSFFGRPHGERIDDLSLWRLPFKQWFRVIASGRCRITDADPNGFLLSVFGATPSRKGDEIIFLPGERLLALVYHQTTQRVSIVDLSSSLWELRHPGTQFRLMYNNELGLGESGPAILVEIISPSGEHSTQGCW